MWRTLGYLREYWGTWGGVVGDTRAHGGEYWGTWGSSGGH